MADYILRKKASRPILIVDKPDTEIRILGTVGRIFVSNEPMTKQYVIRKTLTGFQMISEQ